ncbi:hypothetical protein MYRNA_68 [Mycobacterium phage Myrna]|uniref:Uncharacterized protein n=1 Tax=Mycobacterium phage Myrna TaxID=546805 RepID=B5LJ79_9CAUD|nr:gp68 [Mycobacterium phage Myrna]ACH62076.1 hypothetical protein MYRNA_68 [Mycobacterium phage Myrna]
MQETTQDRLEMRARAKGWTVVESTATKTVLRKYWGTLTVTYALRRQAGRVVTVTTDVIFESFDVFRNDVAEGIISIEV